ncbi:TPA: ATP-binding cassette domain-containing protein [Candidatus Micrarchaeota archaeon]|nr:ATP-binding cassette domain-containing protein [Candidatus Micrarchaeota archaeon]HIH29773.1 ATP-binding cassette domain-containing protein [Candidatus Micrarchaeota archaeon]
MPEEYSILCERLTKKFENVVAVDNLSLRVKKGELFGFLGPNGAGKTTTINMLTTLLPKTAGKARVAEFDLESQAALIRSRIGVVPQRFSLFEELTPMENLWYLGELYEMKKEDIEKRGAELLRIVELYEKKDIPSGTFSGGMKQRLSVAAGLLHQPEILFLDEPTTGLDPQSRIALRELTASLNRSGITVIYTTHDMDEADKLCQRIAIMNYGKLVALGTPSELKELQGHTHKIQLELDSHSPEILDSLKKLAGAISIVANGNKVEMRVKRLKPRLVQTLSEFLDRHNLRMGDFTISEPTLEEVFMSLTKKALRD